MKYTTKIAILPFDRYQRLMGEQAIDDVKPTKVEDTLNHSKNDEEPMKLEEQLDTEKYNVLISIPEYLKRKATLLLNYLNTIDSIKWNAAGNLIINDKQIEGSHIVDLVRNAIVKSSTFDPVGSDEFYANLKNIPLSLIVNEKRLKQLKRAGENDDLFNNGANKSEPPGIPNIKEKSLSEYLQGKNQSTTTKWRKYVN